MNKLHRIFVKLFNRLKLESNKQNFTLKMNLKMVKNLMKRMNINNNN